MSLISTILGATETIATGFWTGSAAGFAFIAAPTVAHEAKDLDLQAKITGATLEKISNVTYAAGGIAIGCALLRAVIDGSDRKNDVTRAIAGVGALALIDNFRNKIVPEMTRLQRAMGGSFKLIPEDDPNRLAYRAAHKRSTRVFGSALLLGLGQLVMGASRDSSSAA
jgi:hypothetical protein